MIYVRLKVNFFFKFTPLNTIAKNIFRTLMWHVIIFIEKMFAKNSRKGFCLRSIPEKLRKLKSENYLPIAPT